MPSLVGIVNCNQAPAIGDILRRMATFLDNPSEIRAMGNAAFAVPRSATNHPNNWLAENESAILVFWGQLWDKEGIAKRAGMGSAPAEGVPTALLLLNLHRNEGLSGLCRLNGRFVIALWDKNEKTLYLISDRHGFCKLFYWATASCILFASEYKAIIRHEDFPARVDEEAIADFMALGYCLGNKTFFEDIKLLPHGSVLTFKNGRLYIERYWNYSFRNGNSPLKEVDEYIDMYYNFLKKAVERQIEGKSVIGLPLSGGLDSRALAGMLEKLGFSGDVRTFSYGNPECFDVVSGKRIAKKLDYAHEYIPIESTYLKDQAEGFIWLTEGTVNCLNAHMMLPHGLIRKNGILAVITGFLGDTVGGEPIIGVKPFKEEVADEGDFVRRVFNRQAEIMTEDEAPLYFRNDVYRTIKGKTFATYKADYMHLQDDNRYFRSIYAELIGRQRRYTSFNLYAFERCSEVLAPFTDNDFVDFALQIPDVLAFTRYVEKEMIIRYLPKVASVPWNKTRLPLNASRVRKGLHWRWERLNRNPIIRATIGKKYAKMNDNYLNTDEAIRTGSRDFVMKHIKDNTFLAEYFNMDRIHQMLDAHMGGKVNEYGKITALLTLSLWHKLFIEGKGFKSVQN